MLLLCSVNESNHNVDACARSQHFPTLGDTALHLRGSERFLLADTFSGVVPNVCFGWCSTPNGSGVIVSMLNIWGRGVLLSI